MIKRVTSLAFAFLTLACFSIAQNARHDNQAFQNVATSGTQGAHIAVIPNALITVCSGTTVPSPGTTCSPITTIYSNPTTGTQANPFNADGNGNYGFYVPPGHYVVSVSSTGLTTYSYPIVNSCDPTTSCTINGGWAVTFLQSVTANLAQSGVLRMGPSDPIAWRDTNAGQDTLIFNQSTPSGNIPGGAFYIGTTDVNSGVVSQFFAGNNSTVAATGRVRLATNDLINWRNNANTADVFLQKSQAANGQLPADTIAVSGITSSYFTQNSSATAAAGLIRMVSGDTINWRNNANNADVSLAKNTNDSLTFAGFVIPQIVAKTDATAQQANISTTTLYAVPSSGAGFYRASCYVVLTQAATTSSQLPVCAINWTDIDTSAVEQASVSNASTANTVGTWGSMNAASAAPPPNVMMYVKASTNISYLTSGYSSSGATPMQYAIHIRLEYLGG